MLSPESSQNLDSYSLQLQQLGLAVRALAELILSNHAPFESVWQVANRVCDRHIPARAA